MLVRRACARNARGFAVLARTDLTLRVVYADPAMLVVDKPAEMLCCAGVGEQKQQHNAVAYLEQWAAGLDLAAVARRPSAFTTVTELAAAHADADWEAHRAAVDAARQVSATLQRNPKKLRRASMRQGLVPYVVTPGALALPDPPPEFRFAPRLCHRLDEATSGLTLFPLTAALHRGLSIHFVSRAVGKVYEAVLDTRYAPADSPLHAQDEGVITTPLLPRVDEPLVAEAGGAGASVFSPAAKTTITRWRVLERGGGCARVEFTPETGRTHQLRLHAAMAPPFGLGASTLRHAFLHVRCPAAP